MHIRLRAFAIGVALFFLVLLVPATTVQVEAQGPGVRGPFTQKGTSAALNGDLRRLSNIPPTGEPRQQPLRGRLSNLMEDLPAVPAGQAQNALPAAAAMPSTTVNFNGIGWTGVGWPPDPNGDVGPNHYIQAVNSSFAVYGKTGTLLAGPITFDTLFAPLGTSTPCGNHNNEGDPVVLYDQLANRWLVSDFGFSISLLGSPQPPYYECIAVSKTSDPVTGGWYLYALLADSTLLNDYPKFGLWPDAYYMTANMYRLSNNDVFVRVWALDRNAMLNGSLNAVFFDLPTCAGTSASCSVYSLLPANLRGALPPAGSPNYLANIEAPNTGAAIPFNSSVVHLWKFHVDWTTPSNSTLTGAPDVAVATFLEPISKSGSSLVFNVIPQQGTRTKLDSLGDRLMMQLQYRNLGGQESLWATHTVVQKVGSTNVAAVRWYQIGITGGVPSLAQQGNVVGSDTTSRWMPSIAVDKNGDAVVGYSASSATIHPGIRYAGRLSTDPAGQMAQGEAVLLNGTGSQTSYLLNPITRWGDFTAMTIDPSDGCTFWYTNEYYQANGYRWRTRIGAVKFSNCQ